MGELKLNDDSNLKEIKHILTVWENISFNNRSDIYFSLRNFGRINFNRELSLFLRRNRVNFELSEKERFKSKILTDGEDLNIINKYLEKNHLEGNNYYILLFNFLNSYLYSKYLEDKEDGFR